MAQFLKMSSSVPSLLIARLTVLIVLSLLCSKTTCWTLNHAPHHHSLARLFSTTSSKVYDPSEAFTDASTINHTIGVLEDVAGWTESSTETTVKDILCDIEHGSPLSNSYLAEKMGLPLVSSYDCPDTDMFRGFMSNACRIQVWPSGDSAFYKHVAFEHLPHAWEKLKNAPFKLRRDMQSYQVVAKWLQSQACRMLTTDTNIVIPKCLDAQLAPNEENPIQSQFTFLLQDLSPTDGWYQQWLLHDEEECEAALDTLAKIHAYFWTGSSFWRKHPDAAEELERSIWPSGSYVQPQAQNDNQCDIVAQEWNKKRERFHPQLSSFDYWDDLGERLQSVAQECGRLAHPFADNDDDALSKQYQQYRTFTHGDPKQANLFFRRDIEGQLQVGLIDFQWSGFGLAATDIAHFLTSAVHADRLMDGGEEQLQQYYFDQLQTYLVEYGAFANAKTALKEYSYETFLEQYDTAVLDLVRLVIAYTWARFEEPVERNDKEGCARTMNKTSYNKCLSNVVWLMSKCNEVMKSRGV